jgi:hypothetical protein
MQEREKQGLPPTINRAESLGFVDFLRTGKKIDPRNLQTDGFDEGTALPKTGEARSINEAFITDKNKVKFAKDGFMGTVSMKTLFTVGEKGKREHVTRKKKHSVFDVDVGFDF